MRAPTSPPPLVGVVGGGVCGLAAARALCRGGVQAVLLERGRAAGGRASTRYAPPEYAEPRWDHGCQYVRPKREPFAEACEEMVARGALAPWEGTFGTLAFGAPGGGFAADAPAAPKLRLVGGATGAMADMCAHLLAEAQREGLGVLTQAEVLGVAPAAPGGAPGGGWEARVRRRGATEAAAMRFDALLATDRALAPALEAVAPGVAAPMAAAGGDGAAPSFALMLELEAAVAGEGGADAPDGMAVTRHPTLAWLSKESSKPGRAQGDAGTQLWTAHSTAGFASAVVEEHGLTRRGTEAHARMLEHVTGQMLEAVREVLRAGGWGELPGLAAPPVAHRWGNAFPAPCVDPVVAEQRFAASPCGTLVGCGDWAAPQGEEGRAEAAYLSGTAAASAVLAALNGDGQ